MSECYRCGQEGHRRSECPRGEGLPASAPQQAAPKYLDASAYRRPASEVSPPVDEYLKAKEQLTGPGMPLWLWKRMRAWQQVADSRRTLIHR